MPVTQITPKGEVDAMIDAGIQHIIKAKIRNLSYIGEQATNIARMKGSYIDRTGNLRSSIGYVVAQDGSIVSKGGFGMVLQGTEGSSDGYEFAKQLAGSFNKGLILIVVAGEAYAGFVSDRGYDVLDSANLIARELANSLLDKYKDLLN